MKIAVLYQAHQAPIVDGIVKPMKKGGYSDSGADIAYCLKKNGIDVITPIDAPSVVNDFDWVFPDTSDGINSAIHKGADTLWLNTVLYKNHPVEEFMEKGIAIIGQNPADVSRYDNKLYTNRFLLQKGLPVTEQIVVGYEDRYSGSFPCVIKPILGRGSQGVVLVRSIGKFHTELMKALDSKRYGDKMMVEEYLPGKEVTISVLPNGICLPVVERYNHRDGIAPYNGTVAVTENSRVITKDAALERLCNDCAKVMKTLDLKALIRIDCRQNIKGEYKIFDVNLKPNMTGAVRLHRENQDSLTMIAVKNLGLSYFDLLSMLLKTKWNK